MSVIEHAGFGIILQADLSNILHPPPCVQRVNTSAWVCVLKSAPACWLVSRYCSSKVTVLTPPTTGASATGKALEVFLAFLRLGVTSFGGPVAHLGYFRAELITKRKWITDREYGELVALCQFLPGPASSQVGFALGLSRGGFAGALAAWVAFTMPSAILLVLFASSASLIDNAIGEGLFTGLMAVAVAVVAHAVWGMSRTLTPDLRRVYIAVGAAAIALLTPGALGQLLAIVAGIVAGLLICKSVVSTVISEFRPHVSKRAGICALVILVILLTALPLLARSTHHLWVVLADAVTRAGAFVFGGGHLVLPLLQAEPAVAEHLTQDQLLAGYSAAQAVPGPLFTFAAYLGYEMDPGVQGIVPALIALIAVFVPGILLLLAALPFWNSIRKNERVRTGMAGANAAVVGILAAALYDPIVTSAITGYAPLIIALGSLVMLTVWKVPAWVVVLLGGLIGAGAGYFNLGLTWA